MRSSYLDSFATVAIMFEFSNAVRYDLISLECLDDLNGVDRQKVTALADSLRRAHADVTGYIVSLIPVPSTGGGAVRE
jgi:hypothetical protein